MGSSVRICERLGAMGGVAVGLVFWQAPGTVPELMIAGILVALIAAGAAGGFLLVIGGYRAAAVLVIVIAASLIIGIVLAPLAALVPSLFLSILACGVIGALIGWLACILLCRYARMPRLTRRALR